MIPIYIGWDSREVIAWHVLADSISKRTQEPCAFIPVGNAVLPAHLWWRPKGPHDSTEFSNARFMVPALQNYQGWAIFMDCDMVCLADIKDLWGQRDDQYVVMVVKHKHDPHEAVKFLGAEQSRYRRKNWSSLVLWNCGHPESRALTPGFVNTARGLDLHGFNWLAMDEIGEIKGKWNVLVAPDLQHPERCESVAEAKLLHYTLGGPWHGYQPLGTELWVDAFRSLVSTGNPASSLSAAIRVNGGIGFAGQFKEGVA